MSKFFKQQTLPTLLVMLIASFVFCITAGMILIWIFRPDLKDFSANAMKFNTALAICCGSVSIWLLREKNQIMGKIFYFIMFGIGF